MKDAPESKLTEFYIVACKTYDESIGGRGYYDSYTIVHEHEAAWELYERLKNSGPVFGRRLEVHLIRGYSIKVHKA